MKMITRAIRTPRAKLAWCAGYVLLQPVVIAGTSGVVEVSGSEAAGVSVKTLVSHGGGREGWNNTVLGGNTGLAVFMGKYWTSSVLDWKYMIGFLFSVENYRNG